MDIMILIEVWGPFQRHTCTLGVIMDQASADETQYEVPSACSSFKCLATGSAAAPHDSSLRMSMPQKIHVNYSG